MISYSCENVKMPAIKKRDTTAWIRRVAATYNKKVGEVGYLFCDDEHILEVNREYLGHDYYTDIITFDYCEDDVLNGDLVISLDTVRTTCHHSRYPASLWYQRQGTRGARDHGSRRKQSVGTIVTVPTLFSLHHYLR